SGGRNSAVLRANQELFAQFGRRERLGGRTLRMLDRSFESATIVQDHTNLDSPAGGRAATQRVGVLWPQGWLFQQLHALHELSHFWAAHRLILKGGKVESTVQ